MNKVQLLEYLKSEGFSKKMLDAFAKVKREDFVTKNLKDKAYENIPLPISDEATISQPYTIAVMLDMLNLKVGQKVLELGSGCGYVLALISEIVGEKGKIYGVEIVKELAGKSKINVKNHKNIKIYNRDGRLGLKEAAPFDSILISAACKEIPTKIFHQLKDKGLLLVPVGSQYTQTLILIQKDKDKLKIKEKCPGFRFVDFV